MLYLTCSMIPSVDFARYGISCVKDLGIRELCYNYSCINFNDLLKLHENDWNRVNSNN